MWNAKLDEVQAGIKIAGRNLKNLRNEDDTTLTEESEEELKSLSVKLKVSFFMLSLPWGMRRQSFNRNMDKGQ